MIKKIRRIINNEYAFSIVAKVFGVVTGLLYSILYSRYMQAELRGEAGVVTNYAELAMLVLCFGMYQAYPYFRKNSDRPIYRDYINMISGVFLLYEGIGLAIILLLRPPLNRPARPSDDRPAGSVRTRGSEHTGYIFLCALRASVSSARSLY